MRHIALLRGINVGGKNKLPMKTLARLFADAGAQQVATYIQSGNVLFDAPTARVAAMARSVSSDIQRRLGFSPRIVLRTAPQWNSAVRHNPFDHSRFKPDRVAVGFLADTPASAKVRALDPNRSPGDQFTVTAGHIYMYCPNGFARTRLTTDYFDRALGTVSTFRNWRTVLKLQSKLAAEQD